MATKKLPKTPTAKRAAKSAQRFAEISSRKNLVRETRKMSAPLGVGILPATPSQAPSEVAVGPDEDFNAQGTANAAALDPSGEMPFPAGTPTGDQLTQEFRRAYGQSPVVSPPRVAGGEHPNYPAGSPHAASVAAWDATWQAEATRIAADRLGRR